MAQFKPKRWQVEDRCGICNSDFSLMNTRHHCRSCGLSVCGKHSRNKVIVPTSLSKVPQRVCDKCYPKCRNVAMGLAPPPRRDLPDDKPRRHTLESRDEREYGHRMRSPRDGARKTAEGARRDNRTWNGDDDYDEPRRIIRRDGEPRTVHSARDRRMRSPRAKSPHAARSPHGRDPREVVSTRGKNPRDRPSREGDLHPNDLFHDPRDKERRHRDPRERDPRDKERRQRDTRERERRRDPRERDPRGRDPRERDPRERDPRERDPRKRDPRERDPRERERRERDPRDRERRDRALHERDLFDDAPRGRSSRDSPAQKERRRIPSTDPTRNRKNEQMRSPAPSLGKHVGSGKVRRDTSSTCRTTSSTLSNLYAAINATEEVKAVAPPPKTKPKRPPPRKEETEKPSAFADSTFSIFSLAGSDHESSEAKARSNAPIKKKAVRRPGASANSANRESMEKKEHLDFSASSSSVKSFEVSAITQKYLKPKPAKAAMEKTTLKPMIEEDSEEESTRGPSRRRADPQAYTGERRRNKVRGETQNDRKMMSPFRRNRPDASFRDSSELMRGGNRKPLAQNSGATMSISDYDEFQETRALLGDDNSISNDDDEAIAELLAASNRGKQDLTAKLRAKKKAIAGIDAASLEAKEKAPTTANYKLTVKDKELMRQISELEATVLQHQKELPDLIDMYSEAMKRSQKAQRELQKAKVRVARYEKAHAAVSRAIRTGKLYMKQKEYMAAILELSRAAGIERSNATLWYLLAECRLKVGQPAAAEDACMTSLKLQPSGAAVAMLGRIMHERGRDDEAIECYLSALGRNDESEDEQDSE
ncbi:Vacuolar protein sorting-associated protein 27 [Phytophthora citrophthora]|uniref:Vacuolar protein sorting-associated protein 27 n=1 Tax=Phytophthora citrophthora TaxID=4793 RepID=A0AAD9H229_9STRA|nr:Vacuolar protein sorting-associated protein 27 [Phytophthora citrophthora]